MSPKISVIVPVYKVEQYLPQCVESILAQTFTDFELLLIDDGSPDNSGKICDEYAAKDSRIRVFHKTNGGVSSARNVGLDNAKGEWIAFVDSDDWIGEHYLDPVPELEEESRSAQIVLSGFNIISSSTGNLIERRNWRDLQKRRFSSSESFFLHKLHLWGFPFSKFYLKSVIDACSIRFSEKISLSEDLLFLMEFLSSCEYVYFSNSCEYYYRVGRSDALSLQREKVENLVFFIREASRLIDTLSTGIPSGWSKRCRWTILKRFLLVIYNTNCAMNSSKRVAKIRENRDVLARNSRFFNFIIDSELIVLFDYFMKCFFSLVAFFRRFRGRVLFTSFQ